MPDLFKIKGNVSKMISMNAPESDIDAYIQAEGVTTDQVKNYQFKGYSDANTAQLKQAEAQKGIKEAEFGETPLGIVGKASERQEKSGIDKFAGEVLKDAPAMLLTKNISPMLGGAIVGAQKGLEDKKSPGGVATS